jgi:hypothetical protein
LFLAFAKAKDALTNSAGMPRAQVSEELALAKAPMGSIDKRFLSGTGS